MTKEIEKIYSPKDIETKWYKYWQDQKFFSSKTQVKDETISKNEEKSFTVIMPPPNVTGALHMGHALDNTVQDVLVRYKRMMGFKTLWGPGMDHAGISTQAVVEKKLWKEEKKKRQDIGRQAFLDEVWSWKDEFGGKILGQLKALGISCDWDYFRFTLDSEANEAVKKTFVKLYNEKLIFQSDYIINWSPKLQSAISDAEVEYKDVKGEFFHISYGIQGSDQKLIVATTRPETLFGDTAVAVNPDDKRFKSLIGKNAILPLCGREIPIIPDSYVDLEVGTGCLKVTPGHDFNDFEIGKRHNLNIINILNKDGTLNEVAGEFAGLSCEKGRKAVVSKLEEQGQLIERRSHAHSVGHCSRTQAIIEPMVSKQWFVNIESMAKDSCELVEKEEMKFIPKTWENTYFSWLRNPRNWCISRQLWWGHQIPVFYCDSCQFIWASEEDEKSCEKCQSKEVRQDEDVLDTWFSSALWPLTILGWPDKNRMKERRFDEFYPTSVLITGLDIIFFWVARMMMMCTKMDEKSRHPFKHVYIHALVKDKQGRKMSKSLGNGIDPLEMIDEYGTDSLRFSLSSGSGHNRGINLDPKRIEGYRNFINKVWNVFRFVYPFIEDIKGEKISSSLHELNYNILDEQEKWMITEVNDLTKKVHSNLDNYRFDAVCGDIYTLVYDKFCSLFIEFSKDILYKGDAQRKLRRANILNLIFKEVLKLLHPICPFITEEIWSYLKSDKEKDLIVTPYPQFNKNLIFRDEQEKIENFSEALTLIRNMRAEVDLKPKDEVEVYLFAINKKMKDFYEQNKSEFYQLAKVKNLHCHLKEDKFRPNHALFKVAKSAEVFLNVSGLVDIAKQVGKIEKEKEKISKDLEKFSKKLSNEKFMNNAPEEVIKEVEDKCNDFSEKLKSLDSRLEMFQKI